MKIMSVVAKLGKIGPVCILKLQHLESGFQLVILVAKRLDRICHSSSKCKFRLNQAPVQIWVHY